MTSLSHDPGKESRRAAGVPIVPALDGFRTFAVVSIVLVHVGLFSGTLFSLRASRSRELFDVVGLSVDLLFMISGFVIFLPMVVRGGGVGDIRAYVRRRAARLVPALWAVLVLTIAIFAIVPPHDPAFSAGGETMATPGVLDFLGHALLIHTPLKMIDPGFEWGLGIDGPMWTLSNELIFYVLLPFVAGLFFRHPVRALAVALAITVGWRVLFNHLPAVTDALGLSIGDGELLRLVLSSDYQFPSFVFTFAAGMAAAMAYVRLIRTPGHPIAARAWLLQPIAFVAVVVSAHLCVRFGASAQDSLEVLNPAGMTRRALIPGVMFTTSMAAFMLLTALARPWQQAVFANRLTRWAADVSYGVYLIHFAVLSLLMVLWMPPIGAGWKPFLIWSAVTLTASFAYGYISARFLENPIRRWAHRFGGRAQIGGAPPGTPPRLDPEPPSPR